jgi:hypothetical protein
LLDSPDLETLIRQYVIFGSQSAKGFWTVKCADCNDYQERGGFKFDIDGSVGYSCFNCGFKTKFVPSDPATRRLPKKMYELLSKFGVHEDELKKFNASLYFNPREYEAAPVGEKKALGFPVKEVPLPDPSFDIINDESPWCEVARAYLETRGLSLNSYTYFVSDREAYSGRLIIPYYFRGKMIYWQARSLDPSIEPRYKNPSVEKDNIFFNMDELYRYTDEPLFVVEGPTDSNSIGKTSVALLGSKLTEFKIRELRHVAQRRKVIFVIDKNKNGFDLGNLVLHLGEDLEWYVTMFPDNISDANDALLKLGRIWMMNYLGSNASKGFQGKLLLKMKCK